MTDGLDTSAGSRESRSDSPSTGPVRLWLDAIETASAEEKDWRDAAQKAVKAYAGEKASSQREFNIFHANVEVIVPALYNSTPAPDVRRRFGDSDPAGKQVADVLERSLAYAVDAYDFDAVMTAAVKDMQVPGRGVVRVRYVPYLGDDGQSVAYQEVRCEHVPWQHFRHGPANDWQSVPWVAFEHFLERDEIEKLVGDEEAAKKVPLNYVSTKDQAKDDDKDKNSLFRRAKVWEIWDRREKKVRFICPDYTEAELKVQDDPLGLDGFFPIPRPLQAIWQTDRLVPVTPLSIYADLVEELNEITRRITRLVKQLRPRGGYPGNADTDMQKLADAEDGEMIPYTSADLLAFATSNSGIEKMLIWWPLEPIVKALQTLFLQREATKQTIYEVTGIADVLRGSTDPNETLGAQELKAQFGSIRIQRQQFEVQRFAADLFNMKAEVVAGHFTPEVLSMMTGIQMQPESIELMRADKLRSYRVDIESDSTIRGDLIRNQKVMAEFLNGTAQFVSSITPLVQTSPGALPAAVALYAAFARQFKLGKSAEDELEKLTQATQQPQEPPPDPNAEKAKAEMEGLKMKQAAEAQSMQLKGQADQQKNAADMQMLQARMAAEQERMALDRQMAEADLQMKTLELQIKHEEHRLKMEEMTLAHQIKMAELAAPKPQGAMQ